MILEGQFQGRCDEVVKHMAQEGIETRPIMAGDFLRCDAIRFYDYSVHGGMAGAEYIHENGFYVGNQAPMIHREIDSVIQVFGELAAGAA